jgi:hypothetical protein
MFKPSLYALALHRLGLSRPIRAVLFLVLFGSFVAGLIYTAVVFHALTERNRAPHVQHHSTH